MEVSKDTPAIVNKPAIETQVATWFTEFYARMSSVKDEAEALTVTDVSQVDTMKRARELRLIFRDIRIAAKHEHDFRKEDIKKEGQAIDKEERAIRMICEPLEERLQKQENFLEIMENQRKDRLRVERTAALRPYMGDDVERIQLGEMDDVAYQNLLESQQLLFEHREKKAKELVEQQQREKKEREDLQKTVQNQSEQIGQLTEAVKTGNPFTAKAIIGNAPGSGSAAYSKPTDRSLLIEWGKFIEGLAMPPVTSSKSKAIVQKVQKKLVDINKLIASELIK